MVVWMLKVSCLLQAITPKPADGRFHEPREHAIKSRTVSLSTFTEKIFLKKFCKH